MCSSTAKPVIGIAVCGLDGNRQFVSRSYIEAVEASGGTPVIIPRVNDLSLFPAYASLCDGFLFCGGDDISPSLFGEELRTDRGITDMATDRFHLGLMRYVLSLPLPVLGICRGMQVLNVARGGSILQDISLRETDSLNHMQLSRERSDASHRVSFSSDSMLYNILGSFADTNSFHHQCAGRIGAGLAVTGRTADGVAEALEDTSSVFRIGVQWHPECMLHSCPAMRKLFLAFIRCARHARHAFSTFS